MSSLPKPILRGHCSRYGRKSLFSSLLFAAATAGGLFFFTAVPRRKAYEEWLKTYDPEAHYKELVKYKFIWSPEQKNEE